MYNRTIAELEEYSDYVEFERLCSDILTGMGFRGLDPQGVEGTDAGKDAVLRINEEEQIVFHFSTREDWERKLREDLEKVDENDIDCSKFVFVSNRQISPHKKDELTEEVPIEYGWEFDIVDSERLRVELDNHRQELRRKYLGIPISEQSHVDDIIEELSDKRGNEVVSFAPAKRYYQRILIMAIPNSYDPNLMSLFDDQYNFVGDKDKLDNVLSLAIPKSNPLIDSIEAVRQTRPNR